VPEVPAIADLAAPGRPDVDAVVAGEEPPAPRRPRPSRHMRARADEMARLLARAAPPARRRRGVSSLPAAAAVLAAVAVGGVGIALGLDAQRAGQQLALPDAPTVPAEQAPVPETGGHDSIPTVDTGVVAALEPGATEAGGARPSSAAAAARTPAPAAPPRVSTTSPRRTTTTPRATTPTDRTTPPAGGTSRSTTSPRPTPRADEDGGAGDPAEDRGPVDLDDGGATSGADDTTAD
jgi:hypothetical protein